VAATRRDAGPIAAIKGGEHMRDVPDDDYAHVILDEAHGSWYG